MHCAVTSITQHLDGTMSFAYSRIADSSVATNDSILFKETFNKCTGKGGNDGRFSGTGVGNGSFVPDNNGWTSLTSLSSSYMYGANKCAKFGIGSKSGSGDVTTPKITLPGDTVTLTFRAAGWNSYSDGTILNVSVDGSNATLIDDGLLMMERGAWTSYSLRIVGSGSCRIEFAPSKRFFLDDVVVKAKKTTTTGIKKTLLVLPWNNLAIYTLDGRYVGTSLEALPHGIYIVGGKKVVR